MPGCVLRASGRGFAVDDFLAGSSLKPCAVWRLGEARGKDLPAADSSGFNLLVSDAPGSDLAAQIQDTISFLETYREELARLVQAPGVESAALDFGIKRRDVAVQCDSFPARLIRLAGDLGMGIELSQYPFNDIYE